MARKPRGSYTEKGAAWAASHGKGVDWARGLTDSDIDSLVVLAQWHSDW